MEPLHGMIQRRNECGQKFSSTARLAITTSLCQKPILTNLFWKETENR
jgi:hypothetical protein